MYEGKINKIAVM